MRLYALVRRYDKGTDDQQKFVQNLALFFTGFFRVGGLAASCDCLAIAPL
jgi:hypothetical protein